MKKFQELLMKDLGWKLLSVAIAAIMWFMVININQPVATRSYSKNIILENMNVLTDRGLIVANADDITNTKATIKIKAQRTALDRLNQTTDWLKASVDLSDLAYAVDGDVVMLPVDIAPQGVYSGYTIDSKSPAVVEVRVEKLTSKELPVKVAVNGEISAGVTYSEPTLSAETVTVKGAASAVERVAAVRAVINAQEIGVGAQIKAKLVSYDAEGVPVKGITTSVSEITVSYEVVQSKKVPIRVNITGTPMAGYSVGEVVSSPQNIEVTGTKELLEGLIYVQLEDIDVSAANAIVRKTYALKDYLPVGISLKTGNSASVSVMVQINSGSARDLTIQPSQLTIIGQAEGNEYELSGTAQITVEGETEILATLIESELQGTVDVSGFALGQHRTMVMLELPREVTAGFGYIDVIVTEKQQEPVEE